MDGKKRHRSGDENSRISQKKLNKLKRHKPRSKFLSAEHVDTDTDESQSDDDDVVVAAVVGHAGDSLPLSASPVHSMPSPPRSDSRSASPSGSSVASNLPDSDNEGDVDDRPPTPDVPGNEVVPVEEVNLVEDGDQSNGPRDCANFPDDVPLPLNLPPPIEGLENRQADIAKRRAEHLREGTNGPNFLHIIIFFR